MKRKHKGSSLIFEPPMWLLVIVFLVFVIAWFSPIATRISAGNLYREYKIEMATDGFLTSENRRDLINDLTEAGCKNIKITATDSKVKWGENLSLIIEYDTTYKTTGKNGNGNFLSLEDKLHRVVINDKKLISLST